MKRVSDRHETSKNNELLCAYITVTGDRDKDKDNNNIGVEKGELISNLKEYLKKKLPDSMIPDKLAIIENIPRKPNGKVDYEMLHKEITYGRLRKIPA